jgi:hypothetical protein
MRHMTSISNQREAGAKNLKNLDKVYKSTINRAKDTINRAKRLICHDLCASSATQ